MHFVFCLFFNYYLDNNSLPAKYHRHTLQPVIRNALLKYVAIFSCFYHNESWAFVMYTFPSLRNNLNCTVLSVWIPFFWKNRLGSFMDSVEERFWLARMRNSPFVVEGRFTMADSRLQPWCSGGAGVNFFDIPNMSAIFSFDIYSFSNYLSTAEKYFLWSIFSDCFIIFAKHLCGFKNNSMLQITLFLKKCPQL